MTATRLSRRGFLTGLAGAGAVALSGTPARGDDTFTVNLAELGVAPEPYTTTWPTGTNITVKVWDAAFRAAHDALAAHGGGRLIVPANADIYYLRDHQIFDLPSVSVHLQAGSEIMMVGPKNPKVGTPIGFYGGLGDGQPPRRQQNFAALIGPGRIGFPAEQLEYYERGNAVGFSYIKTAVVDGITVPCAPRYAMTAQYGCNSVTFRNNRIGYTGTPEEILLGGHAVLNVTGGLYDDATGKEFPGWLRTTVQIEKNVIESGQRAAYIEQSGAVSIVDNTFGPMAGTGITVADCTGATLTGNTFAQVKGGGDVIQVVDVSDPVVMQRNVVSGRTHGTCVRSRDTANSSLTAAVIRSRQNRWTKGAGAVFSGAPAWDSVGDTVL